MRTRACAPAPRGHMRATAPEGPAARPRVPPTMRVWRTCHQRNHPLPLRIGPTPPFRCGRRERHHWIPHSTCRVCVLCDFALLPARCGARRRVGAVGTNGGHVFVTTSPIAPVGTIFAGAEGLSQAAVFTLALTRPSIHPLGSRRRLHQHRGRHALNTCRPHASYWPSF